MKQLIFTLMLASAMLVQAQVQTNGSITENDSTFTVNLGDVVVTATRDIQRLSKGGLVTNVNGTSLSNLGTCSDVISQLPGVISNEGNLEVLGRGTPQIYINGRKLVDKSTYSGA